MSRTSSAKSGRHAPAYEKHSDSVELWSPGNPLFKRPDFVAEVKEDELPQGTTLKDLLDR